MHFLLILQVLFNFILYRIYKILKILKLFLKKELKLYL